MGFNEETILQKMGGLRISRQVLARVSEIREGDLCRGLKCVQPLRGPEIERLNQILDDLKAMQQRIAPFELPVSDVQILRSLLDKFRSGEFDQILAAQVSNDFTEPQNR